jgi:hypothetical protein
MDGWVDKIAVLRIAFKNNKNLQAVNQNSLIVPDNSQLPDYLTRRLHTVNI